MLSLKVRGSNLDSGNFDFIEISAQIINNFSKFLQQNNNLIYAEIVKVLQ